MKKKIELYKAINVNEILKRIIDNKDLNINCISKFKLLGIMKALEPVVANFEFVKNEKIKEYGKEDDNGQVSINPEEEPETFKKYQKEIEELLSTFVKVDTIKAEDVIDKDIPADALVAIYDLIGE
ncbi:MAG: hypothetical protein K1W00_05270 [Lachnospiraceae bacterium]|mgnify:CR=1 FL=1